MATFLNTVLNNVLLSLETEYNVYEVYDADDANVILNDVQEASFPVAFFSIKNNGAITLTRHKKSYPVYDVAVWLLNLYEEDNKSELETNYEGLRLDALEFLQRFQRTTAFARVPTNTVLTPRVEEFDAQLDLLATAVQITFTASIDIEEDTSRVCAPLSISSFTLNDTNLDAVVLDASASSYRGTASGSTAGTHAWSFVMNGTSVSISGLATSALSASDIASLSTIGMINATGTYNSFTFEKNPDSIGAFNFVISVSHTYDFRSNSEASPATTDVISKRIFFVFQTTWNTATDGAFSPNITGGVTTWLFGTDTATGANPSYTGSYLDGSVKTVIVSNTDFSAVSSITFLNDRIDGALDFSIFTNSSLIADITSTSGTINTIREFKANSNSFSSLRLDMQTTPVGGDVDLSGSNVNGVLEISRLKTFIQPNAGTLTTFSIDGGVVAGTNIDISNCTLTGGLGVFFFFPGTPIGSITLNPAAQTITNLNLSNIFTNNIFDFSQITLNGGLSINYASPFASLQKTLILGGGNITSINSSNAKNKLQLGSANIGDFTTSCTFFGAQMIASEIDAIIIELDRIALTRTAGVLNIDLRNNSARSVASDSAVASLITKNYNLLF